MSVWKAGPVVWGAEESDILEDLEYLFQNTHRFWVEQWSRPPQRYPVLHPAQYDVLLSHRQEVRAAGTSVRLETAEEVWDRLAWRSIIPAREAT